MNRGIYTILSEIALYRFENGLKDKISTLITGGGLKVRKSGLITGGLLCLRHVLACCVFPFFHKLQNTDLSYADLSYADLSYADLSYIVSNIKRYCLIIV